MANRYIRSTGGDYNAAGTWELTPGGGETVAVPSASDDVIGTSSSGQLTITAAAVAKTVDLSAYTNTLTHNAFTWTVSGSITFSSSMTYTLANASTSAITMNATGTLTTAGKTIGNFVMSAAGATYTAGDDITSSGTTWNKTAGTFAHNNKTVTLTGAGTVTVSNGGPFYNLTRTGNAATTAAFVFTQPFTVTNALTFTGNSRLNQLLVRASTFGTSLTITTTGATVTATNTDFRDVTLSTTKDWSASTDIGDCGGNGGITFPAAVTQTYTGGTGSWSDVTKWTSRVPLPQDDVLMSGVTGGTITADMPRLGKKIDWTGASGSPAWSITTNTACYGGFDLTGLTTLGSFGAGGLLVVESQARTGTIYIKTNGKAFTATGNRGCPINFQAPNTTVELLDDLTTSSNAGSNDVMSIIAGTLKIGNYTLTTRRIASTAGTTLTFGSGSLVLNATQGTSSFQTVNCGTGSIVMTNTGSTAKTLSMNGQTYNDLLIYGGGTGAIIIAGSNSFDTFTAMSPKTVTFTSGTTQTITTPVFEGTAGNIITLNTTAAGAATLAKAGGGTVTPRYTSITNINVTPAGTWYYDTSDTYVSGTGWNRAGGLRFQSHLTKGLRQRVIQNPDR